MSHEFTNWSHTVTFRCDKFEEPKSEADVVQIVKDAAANKKNVRVQGAGHSFSQLLTTNDVLVSLDDIPDTCTVNGNLATVNAGIRLKELIKVLKSKGLALRNLGSVTEQSIAGAFSTGTHGTGLKLASLSSMVTGVKLVDGKGQVQVVSAADLPAARLSLGLLGIYTEVTLDCVPHYQLEYNAYVCRFDDIVDRMDELAAENERARIWWLRPKSGPGDTVIIITQNPIGAPPGFPADEPNLDDDLSPGLFGSLSFDLGILGNVLGIPAKAGRFRRFLTFKDDYNKVLTLEALPLFHREMEYAIPAQHASKALKQVRHVLDEGDQRLFLPIEVRYVAPETHLLSTSLDRPQGVVYIGVSPGPPNKMNNSAEVFERFEPLMRTLGGRPHWGKHYSLTREDLDRMYPTTHNAFVQTRQRFDPNGVFLNSLLLPLFE